MHTCGAKEWPGAQVHMVDADRCVLRLKPLMMTVSPDPTSNPGGQAPAARGGGRAPRSRWWTPTAAASGYRATAH